MGNKFGFRIKVIDLSYQMLLKEEVMQTFLKPVACIKFKMKKKQSNFSISTFPM